jgi:hypothetical protein
MIIAVVLMISSYTCAVTFTMGKKVGKDEGSLVFVSKGKR